MCGVVLDGLPGWGQVSTDEEALPTRILFVFDASNSMNAFGEVTKDSNRNKASE